MGRPKDEEYWNQVSEEEDGRLKCNHCGLKFKGGVSRIKAHVDRIEGKGIRICSFPPNHVTSSNHSHHVITVSQGFIEVAERAGEMTDTVGGLINHETVKGSTLLGGDLERIDNALNPERTASLEDYYEGGNGSLTSTLQSNLDVIISDLTSKEEDIQTQLQVLESRGKKRKREVDHWLYRLQEMKQFAIDMKNSLNQFECLSVVEEEIYLPEISEEHNKIQWLTKKVEEHEVEKPSVLSNEFVGSKFGKNVRKIQKLLKDDRVLIIGIYGIGGVGKTFLATYMQSEIKRNKTFKDVLWVTVSHDFTIFRLLQQIAEITKVKLYEADERKRAMVLASELEKRGKIVLILDDVWKYIDLEKVGIPLGVKDIKLIMTGRLKHVFEQMDCEAINMISVSPFREYFDGDEAWELFLLKHGHFGTPSTLPPEVENIARYVVRACDGLPLGINVIARIMKGKTDIYWWRHALNKLDTLKMGVEMQEEVLSVIRRSYDNLTEKDVQKCFLYSALLPNYLDIDDLIMKLVDRGLLNGKRSFKEIFNEGNVMVDKLINHSLLLDNSSDNSLLSETVKMHGLVRKMAWNILKESGSNMMVKCNKHMEKIPHMREWTIDLEAVSLANNRIEEIPEGTSPNCPRLSTLLLFDNLIKHIPGCFFTHMNALTTLDLSKNEELTCLPHSLSNLRSLTSLTLNECSRLEYIPPLGELQSLLRLQISGCSIQAAPEGLENLMNLEWLDLSMNPNLKLVPGSFLPSLTNIQYLDLCGCLGINVEDVQGMTMLECFLGTFVDRDNLNRYVQEILDSGYGPQSYLICHLDLKDEEHWKRFFWKPFLPKETLFNFDCRSIYIGDCKELPYVLPRDLAILSVEDNHQWECFCAPLSSNRPKHLTHISVVRCTNLKSLFCLSCSSCANIEYLSLYDLKSLTAICKEDIANLMPPPSPRGIFSYLRHFDVSACRGIKTLLTPSLVPQLQNLKFLSVSDCDSMEQIFAESYDDGIKITLPKLITLKVRNLPQLKMVCKGILVCKSGFELDITDCPNSCQPRIEYVAL
ncbi:probable disease resistance protein At4g27220 [Phaseolus vulgaris]|uniref:probable disease resistance protein At4g27220 n=1 Tax=Phaseolus vulgaris TaxID=3885 RepID=UPI0035CBA2F0